MTVCVEVLRPSQLNRVMSSAVSLPNHTFTGQAQSSKRLTSIVHILSPETDNCPSWISGRERMTVENISWSISTKECCRSRRGLNPRPPGLQSDGVSNWATEAVYSIHYFCNWSTKPLIRLLILQADSGLHRPHMSQHMIKHTKWQVCPEKTQINLDIHPVQSQSSLSARRKLGSLATHWVHS